MNTVELLKSLRVNAVVLEESGDKAKLSSTNAQYEALAALLDKEPAPRVKDGKLVFSVSIAELAALVEAGKTAKRAAAEVTYEVRKVTSYLVSTSEETVNNVERLTWYDDSATGIVRVNAADFTVNVSTAGDLLQNAPNAERKLFYIVADVSGKPRVLHNGSIAGLIKRLINFGKLIEVTDATAAEAEAETDEE